MRRIGWETGGAVELRVLFRGTDGFCGLAFSLREAGLQPTEPLLLRRIGGPSGPGLRPPPAAAGGSPALRGGTMRTLFLVGRRREVHEMVSYEEMGFREWGRRSNWKLEKG